MRILLIITILVFSFSTKSFSFTHDKIIKDLNKAADQINKIGNSQKNNTPKSSSSKKSNDLNPNKGIVDSKCNQNKNIILYNQTDKYLRVIGPEKFKSKKIIFSNFSFISQKPGEKYLVEYVFDENGSVKSTNLENCKVINYSWVFKGRGGEDGDIKLYLGNEQGNDLEMIIGLSNSQYYKNKILFHRKGQITNCYNYQNPQCNQFIAETKLVGFRDLKDNKTYAQLKEGYMAKVAEANKKKEEERQAAQRKRDAEIKAREDRERAYQQKQDEENKKREEARKKREEYNNSPEGILKSSYQEYMLIKDFYEVRENYAVKYVNSQQFSNARKQIKEIESAITKKNGIKSDKVWNEASELYKKQWASTMEIYKSTGSYTQQASGIAKLALMSLSGTYSKLVQGGAQAPKKDF